jgi:hypothetical protein
MCTVCAGAARHDAAIARYLAYSNIPLCIWPARRHPSAITACTRVVPCEVQLQDASACADRVAHHGQQPRVAQTWIVPSNSPERTPDAPRAVYTPPWLSRERDFNPNNCPVSSH